MTTRIYKKTSLRVKPALSNHLTINCTEQYMKEAAYKRQLKQRAINNTTTNNT